MILPTNEVMPTVMHIDLNSCFASCEQQANPLLRGKPVAVAAYATPRGCILAASYEAKRLGVKTGMRVFEGRELCPNLIVKEPDPHMYRYVSQKLMALFREYTPDCVQKSVDEAVLDFSDVRCLPPEVPMAIGAKEGRISGVRSGKAFGDERAVRGGDAGRVETLHATSLHKVCVATQRRVDLKDRSVASVGALHVTPLRERRADSLKRSDLAADSDLVSPSPLPKPTNRSMYSRIDTYSGVRKVPFQQAPIEVVESQSSRFYRSDVTSDLQNDSLHCIGMGIKRRIKEEIGDWLTVNIGIGPNRFLAKTASSWHKPDGLDEINAQNLRFALSEFGLRDLCGINYRLEERLNLVDIFTPIDLLNADLLQLRRAFGGICGYYWHLRIRGYEIDKIDFPRRSFGQSYALPHPTSDLVTLSRLLLKLCEKMGRRLRESSFSAGGIHVACAYASGEGWHHGEKVSATLYSTRSLYHAARRVLLSAPKLQPVRTLAVSCFDLRPNFPAQQYLFEDLLEEKHLSDAMDKINDRYGEFTVVSARMLGMEKTIVERIAFGK